MATAQTIIDRALRLISAIGSGESPTADESADGLIALNNMLESWQADKLTVYAYVDTAYTMVASTGSYTVGPSGNFNLTPRPTKIEQCFVRANSIDYPVELIDKQRWYAITDKTVESDIPEYAYYEPTLTTGTLKIWPVPNTGNSLHIITWTTVASLVSLATSISLPQGYERAMAYNLAVEIAPEYEREASATVQRIAAESYAAIKRMNNRQILAMPDLGTLVGPGRSDIWSGGFV